MSHLWPKMKLMDLINYKKGFAFKSRDYIQNGIPVIRVTNFTENSISSTDLKFVSHEVAEANHNVALKEHDIVIATVGSWPNNPASVVGRTICVPQWASNALMNQNSVILRSNSASTIDQMFIYYQLKSEHFSNYVISKAQGSANQASITLDSIFSYEIHWPSAFERKAIVNILAALDDRIGLLRETNTTLETIAQALFKSWFVDFDPVRAKAEGREPEGIDAETAALFPDSFEESELGLVPKGWRVGVLADCCEKVESGGTPKRTKPEYWDGTIDWLTSGEVRNAIVYETKEKITLLGLKESSAKIWPSGTTVVAMYGATAGAVCLLAEPVAANQACCGLIPREETKSFLFLSTRRESQNLASKSSGSAQQNLNKGLVSSHKIIMPPNNICMIFEETIKYVFDRWIVNDRSTKTLANLRDTLLPRLISGYQRLPEDHHIHNRES